MGVVAVTPDRSNCASFYDPEHPFNNRMPTTGDFYYNVEVDCYDPVEQCDFLFWAGVEAHDHYTACEKAMADAERWGYQPRRIESCQIQ